MMLSHVENGNFGPICVLFLAIWLRKWSVFSTNQELTFLRSKTSLKIVMSETIEVSTVSAKGISAELRTKYLRIRFFLWQLYILVRSWPNVTCCVR